MAAALEDGRLVVVTADQHTGYQVNDCVDDVVHDYLIDLEARRRSETQLLTGQRVKLGGRFSVNALTASACSGDAQHSSR